jgi:hypothetical protein
MTDAEHPASKPTISLGPLGLILVALIAILSLLFILVVVSTQWLQERWFVRRMRAAGRFILWQDLEPKLRAGEGTLVIEGAMTGPVRVWWAEENILALAPVPPPAEHELARLLRDKPQPFVAWCFGRYLEPKEGTALLTKPPATLPAEALFAGYFRKQYPGLNAIDTVYCRRTTV